MKFEWEDVVEGVRRAKVFGGWIVTINNNGSPPSAIFLTDTHYEWSINYDKEKS